MIFFQFFFLAHWIYKIYLISALKSSCIESIVHRVHQKNINLCKTRVFHVIIFFILGDFINDLETTNVIMKMKSIKLFWIMNEEISIYWMIDIYSDSRTYYEHIICVIWNIHSFKTWNQSGDVYRSCKTFNANIYFFKN